MIYTLTEEQLMDYLYCPVFYGLRFNSKLKVERAVTMPKLVQRVINAFCSKLRDGEVMRMDIVKRKWDMLCKEYPEVMTQENIREGYGHLNRFYRWAAREELRVATLGDVYTIRQKLDNGDYLDYKGSLNVIMANKYNKPENLKFWFATRLPDQADLDLALKTTLDHVGFYQLYGQPLIGTRVHHLRKDKDFYTVRDVETAKERVLAVTRNVFKSIQQDIWYPHEGPMCQKCQVRDFCLMYGSNLV